MTVPLSVTRSQALAFRLDRQHLLAPAPDALAAARTLVGAQAQVHSAAILQLRARSPTPDSSAASCRVSTYVSGGRTGPDIRSGDRGVGVPAEGTGNLRDRAVPGWRRQ